MTSQYAQDTTIKLLPSSIVRLAKRRISVKFRWMILRNPHAWFGTLTNPMICTNELTGKLRHEIAATERGTR